MTDPITFEDVLDELMLEEPKPDYEALVRWQERYPKYRKELADFFATWSVQEHRAQFGPQTPIDEEKLVKKGVEHVMEILRRQGRIIDKTERSEERRVGKERICRRTEGARRDRNW